MKLTILGTGGGRWVVLRQIRASGGFVLELGNQKIHVDPGPGSLVSARENRVDLCDLTAVMVSHRHQDHMNDAIVAIESMTKGVTKKRGAFISTERVIRGDKDHPPILDSYHRGMLERIRIIKAGDSFRAGNVKITATPTKHREETGVGFVFEGEGLKIGYTSDGEYFSGMEKHFIGMDYLIMNVLRPRTDSWPGHMNSLGARKLVSKARPKTAILNHFGMKMLRGVAEKEASWIERETGVRTIAAKDGMVIETAGSQEKQISRGLKEFLNDNGD